MKKVLHLVGTIAMLVAIYYLLQAVFVVVSEFVALGIAVCAGDVSKEVLEFVDNKVLFLKDNPFTTSYIVYAQAWGLLLSSLAMLLFIHSTGLYKLRKELFKDIDKKTECDDYDDIIDTYSEDTGELLCEWN
jgi:hypothetical protein